MRAPRLGIFFLLLSLAAAADPRPSAGSELRVLTYNVWGLPRPLSRDRKPRILGLCEYLRGAARERRWDVILLQEAWTPKIQSVLSTCGYDYNAMIDDGGYQSGLMILSLNPVREIRETRYTRIPASWASWVTGEYFARKSVLSAVIEMPDGRPVRVMNTHLVSNYGPRRTFDSYRRQQVQELAEEVQRLKGGPPVVLGGDFNLSPFHSNYSPLWDDLMSYFPGFTEAPYLLETCTFCSSNPYARRTDGKLDHLFAGPGISAIAGELALDRDGEIFSDHYGWQGRFEY